MPSIKFDPRDVWIGWFWDRRKEGTDHYVCIVPMVVIHWFRPRWHVVRIRESTPEEIAQHKTNNRT
jgi:hypothetical protein